MELHNSSQDDTTPAGPFVRDWRIRRISPSTKLMNPDGVQIVRRRTVITIGSMSQLKGSESYRNQDQPISASEVGETACGRISITVKTLPKSTDIDSSFFESQFNNLQEDNKATSCVIDPPLINTDNSVLEAESWMKDAQRPTHDIDTTVVSGHLLPNINSKTLINNKLSEGLKKPVYSVTTEIDIDQPPKVNLECASPRISLKPTFKMILGNESKILHLSNPCEQIDGVEKCETPRQAQQDSMTCDYIRYHEWLKTLERAEEDLAQPQPKVRINQSIVGLVSGDYIESCGSVGNSSTARNDIIVVESTKSHLPKSILKQGRNDSSSSESTRSDYIDRKEKNNLIRNHRYPEENAVGNKKEDSTSLVRPYKSETNCNNQDRNSSCSFITKLPPMENQLCISPKIEDYTKHRQPAPRDAADNALDVINKNQINSMRSNIDTSGCWKTNPSLQEISSTSASLSSGMAIDKATELVRQFFNAAPRNGEVGQDISLPDVVDEKTSPDKLKDEDNHQTNYSSIQLPTLNHSIEEEKQQQQQRGRSLIKSKIPLRIQRPANSVSPASSHSNSSSALIPSHGPVNNVSSRYMANKPKPIANRISRIPMTGRTRSVEGYSRQAMTSLSNSLLYTPAAREQGIYEKANTSNNGYRKVNPFHQTPDYFNLYH